MFGYPKTILFVKIPCNTLKPHWNDVLFQTDFYYAFFELLFSCIERPFLLRPTRLKKRIIQIDKCDYLFKWQFCQKLTDCKKFITWCLNSSIWLSWHNRFVWILRHHFLKNHVVQILFMIFLSLPLLNCLIKRQRDSQQKQNVQYEWHFKRRSLSQKKKN